MVLPPVIARAVIDAGWGVPNVTRCNGLLIFGPRDEEELDVVWMLLRISFHYGLDSTAGAIVEWEG